MGNFVEFPVDLATEIRSHANDNYFPISVWCKAAHEISTSTNLKFYTQES